MIEGREKDALETKSYALQSQRGGAVVLNLGIEHLSSNTNSNKVLSASIFH